MQKGFIALANYTPTPYARLNALLVQFVGEVRDLLADTFVGAYLQGSFATGGIDEYSDVDFVIMLNGDITDVELPLLQELHERTYALPSPWAKHLEGSYIPKWAIETFPPPQRAFWYLDHGSKHLIRSEHDDTLVVYWTLREKGITLIGPEPRQFLSPVPPGALRKEIHETMPIWRDHFLANPGKMNNRFYQPFVVLSYCRMLHSLATDAIDSKPAAAAWALHQLDACWHDLIRHALAARPGDAAVKVRQPADPDALRHTWLFIAYAIELGHKWMHSAPTRH